MWTALCTLSHAVDILFGGRWRIHGAGGELRGYAGERVDSYPHRAAASTVGVDTRVDALGMTWIAWRIYPHPSTTPRQLSVHSTAAIHSPGPLDAERGVALYPLLLGVCHVVRERSGGLIPAVHSPYDCLYYLFLSSKEKKESLETEPPARRHITNTTSPSQYPLALPGRRLISSRILVVTE
jgi:hypothetical protein